VSRSLDSGVLTVADRPFGWLLVIVLPCVVFFLLSHNGLGGTQATFVAVVSSALTMWMFSLLPELIPALLALLLCMLLGLAPPEVVLSGFSSNGFLLTFSVLGLGVVVTTSGLTLRYSLKLIKHLPPNTFWYQLALFFTGFLFTPIVPSIAGRAAINGPILDSLANGIDAETRQKASGLLYSSGLDSTSFLAATFLTSTPANLIVFGMLPQQSQQAYEFIHWFFAASVTTTVIVLLYFVLSAGYFRAYRRAEIDEHAIDAELKRIGKMSVREWFALLGIAVLAIGIFTSSIHKIPLPYIAFTVFFVLLYLNVLTREDFVKKIDWSFLFLLAGLIGILRTMNHLQLDKVLAAKLDWLGDYMIHDFESFVLFLTLAIVLVRLSLPINSTVLIFCAGLIPIANANGVDPWLVGFIVLLISETSLLPYQSPHIQLFRSLVKGGIAPSSRDFFVFHSLLLAAKILAIFASIPFWSRIGVL